MKNRKKKILCAIMTLPMIVSMPVKAVEQKAIVLQAQQEKVSAELHIPSNQQDNVSTMKVSFQVEAEQGKVNHVDFDFDEKITSTVQECRYQEDTGILTIYLSGGMNLFSKENVLLGNFVFDAGENAKINVSLKEDSFEYVTSSSQVAKEVMEKESVEWINKTSNSSPEETTKQEQETTKQEQETTKQEQTTTKQEQETTKQEQTTTKQEQETKKPSSSSSKRHWTTGQPVQETTQAETTTEAKKNPETVQLVIQKNPETESESNTTIAEPSRETETTSNNILVNKPTNKTENSIDNNRATTGTYDTWLERTENSSNNIEESSTLESSSASGKISEIEETASTDTDEEITQPSSIEEQDQKPKKKTNQGLLLGGVAVCGAVSLAVAWISKRYK